LHIVSFDQEQSEIFNVKMWTQLMTAYANRRTRNKTNDEAETEGTTVDVTENLASGTD